MGWKYTTTDGRIINLSRRPNIWNRNSWPDFQPGRIYLASSKKVTNKIVYPIPQLQFLFLLTDKDHMEMIASNYPPDPGCPETGRKERIPFHQDKSNIPFWKIIEIMPTDLPKYITLHKYPAWDKLLIHIT